MLVKAVHLIFETDEAELIVSLLAKEERKFLLPSAIYGPKFVAPIGATVFVETFSFEPETKTLKVFGDIAW